MGKYKASKNPPKGSGGSELRRLEEAGDVFTRTLARQRFSPQYIYTTNQY